MTASCSPRRRAAPFGATPETVDFNGPTGQSFIRQALLRYTAPLGEGSTLAAAIENPQGDFTTSTGGASSSVLDQFPDVVANFTHRGAWGHVSLRGLVREIRTDNGASIAVDDFGYGVGFAGSFKTFGKDQFIYQFSYGDGIGRYIQDAVGQGAGFLPPNRLDTQVAWGGFAGYQHFWRDNVRSTLVYGHTEIDNEASLFTPAVFAGLTQRLESLHVNLIWSPVPKVDLGIEYIYGEREVEGGAKGDISRIQFGAKYRFF